MVAVVTVEVELHLLKKKNALSVQVHIFYTTYSEILSTFYEIPHLVDGIVTWTQAAKDRDGWKGATRKALTLLGKWSPREKKN